MLLFLGRVWWSEGQGWGDHDHCRRYENLRFWVTGSFLLCRREPCLGGGPVLRLWLSCQCWDMKEAGEDAVKLGMSDAGNILRLSITEGHILSFGQEWNMSDSLMHEDVYLILSLRILLIQPPRQSPLLWTWGHSSRKDLQPNGMDANIFSW